MEIKVLIVDAFGYWHVGNGALLECSINLLKESIPDSEITILSTDAKTVRKYYSNTEYSLFDTFSGKNKLYKLLLYFSYSIFCIIHLVNLHLLHFPPVWLCFSARQRRAMKLMLSCDVGISISGEAINDIFWKNLLLLLFQYHFLISHGKKFILFPQSIGPLEKPWLRKLVYRSLNGARLLVARDKPSYELLANMGFDSRQMGYSIDVAVEQQSAVAPVNVDSYFGGNVYNKATVGITFSSFVKELSFKSNVLDFLFEKIIAEIDNSKYRILFMPSNYAEGVESDDYRINHAYMKKFKDAGYEVAILENKMHMVQDYVSILEQLFVFVSTRMHVSILATSHGIPTLAISSQHKIKSYMGNLNMSDFALLPNELTSFESKLQLLLKQRDAISHDLRIAVDHQKDVSLEKLKRRIHEIARS